MIDPAMEAVLGAASAAVLAVYRPDGEIVMSPAWFRAPGDWVEIVVAEGDAKLEHLRNDARCVFIAFETVPPFARVRIRLGPAPVRRAVWRRPPRPTT